MHVAELNIGRLKHPIDDPRMADFVDNLARVIEGFVDQVGLERYAIYVFDYGAPVGFRLALARPERVAAIISQNGNAYEEGLSDGWTPIRKYWQESTAANRDAIRQFLTPETTKWQYVHGVSDEALVAPESYTLDSALLARPGNDEIQLDLFLDARCTAERCSLWLLRHRRPPLRIDEAVRTFRTGLDWLTDHLGAALRGHMRESVESTARERIAAGVPAELARRSAIWKLLHTGFDLVDIASSLERPLDDVARAYWHIFDRMDLLWLWEGIGALPRSDRWQTQARSALRDDVLGVLEELTRTVMTEAGGSVDAWVEANERSVNRALGMFTEIRRAETYDLTNLSVALRQLRNLGLTSVGES